jgi:hypothetical protein
VLREKSLETKFQAYVVWLILDGKVEEALGLLAEHYRVDVPRIRVGLPKGHRKDTLGCYTAKNKTISVLNSDGLKEPFTVLHEFYHHLRTAAVDRRHRGTERNASAFANEFIGAYRLMATES